MSSNPNIRIGPLQEAELAEADRIVRMAFGTFLKLPNPLDFLGDRRIRDLRAVWIHAIGNAIALILAIFNVFVHSRDAYTSVVPTGLILSILTVLILLVTAWMGGELVYRHRVGVLGDEP